MSFGFSVGDVVALYKLASDIRRRFIDAPSQFQAISKDIKSLSHVLADVNDLVDQRDIAPPQQRSIREKVESCGEVLSELQDALDSYQDVDSRSKGLRGRSRLVWKKMNWDKSLIDNFRQRITLNIGAFNTLLEQIAINVSYDTKDAVYQLQEREDNRTQSKEQRQILDWLTLIDYGLEHADYFERLYEGTGQWLLGSKVFDTWLEKGNRILFCPGIPGAGKTTLTAAVIDHLQDKFEGNEDVGIAFIYCNFNRKHEQKPPDLFLNLLKQFAKRKTTLPDCVKEFYEKYKKKSARPPLKEILQVLQTVIEEFSRAFIIVDALDECQVSRKEVIHGLLNLQTTCNSNIFATSRFIPDIEAEFLESSNATLVEIKAHDEDVRRYLEGLIGSLPPCISRSRNLQEQVITEILKAVQGMYEVISSISYCEKCQSTDKCRFLLAHLHINFLAGLLTPKEIKIALKKLPTGSDAYDFAYEEALKRIRDLSGSSHEHAMRAISWITCAQRRLTADELRHGLAVEVDEPGELDEFNLLDIEDIISICAGLVTYDKESNVLRFIHYTTQEFFERRWREWFPNVHKDIAITCITYLSYDTFEGGLCQSDSQWEYSDRLLQNPLYEYAAYNWGDHARLSYEDVAEEVSNFLQSDKLIGAAQLLIIKSANIVFEFLDNHDPEMTGSHIAAYFGLAKYFLSNRSELNSEDIFGRTPLSLAAERNQGEVVRELMQADGIDPDHKDKEGKSPLFWASEAGHGEVVKQFLGCTGVDPDSCYSDSRTTPLIAAAEGGHLEVVKLLLDTKGVNFESKDLYDRSPLSYAASNGHETVVKEFLSRNVDPDSKARDGRTPLYFAAWEGHEAIVKLLLSTKNVKVETKDHLGWTPISRAGEAGFEKTVKLLVDNGADPNTKNKHNRTVLSWAAHRGHESVVKLLLSFPNVEVDSKDDSGWSALSWAAKCGHRNIVDLLLDKGADIDSKDNSQRTPLAWAVFFGIGEVVDLLITRGANTECKNWLGQSVLSIAAERGQKTMVKLLLKKYAGSAYGDETTPPSGTVEEVTVEVAKKLSKEQCEAILDLRSNDGRTALAYAVENGHGEVVKLLLAAGANPEIFDNKERTPLSLAAECWLFGNVVEQLLAMAPLVKPDSKDIDGRSPVSYAAEIGMEACVKLLLSTGVVSVDDKDKHGKSPLDYATEKGHHAVVQLLLKEKG